MNIEDILALSFKDLNEKKVRTALTVIMVVIGVASIVALVSLTAGISASISSELSALGPTSIIMSSTGITGGFTQATVSEIESLPNVSSVTPVLEGTGTVRYGNENATVTIIGLAPQNLDSFLSTNVSLYQGTIYSGSVSPESVIGYDIAFPSTSDGRQNIVVGQPIVLTVGGGRSSTSITVPVVGILQSAPTLTSVDSAVLMSLPAAETILHKTSYNTLIVKATNASTVSGTANVITAIYGSTARITTTEELAQTAASIVGDISTLLILIAGISLVVAAIGIMNVMLISVYERIHEIGILKAVGFKNRNILTIFIIQALIIGFFGGIVGIAVGAGGAYTLTALINSASANSSGNSTATTQSTSGGGGFRTSSGAGGSGGGAAAAGAGTSSSSSLSITPVISLSTIITAMLVAVIVSVAAGAYPAWRASKLEPIEALRTL